MLNRRALLGSAAAAALGGATGAYAADAWPVRPVKFIVPYPPGGPIDGIARLITPRMSADLGQQVVIDNRGGAAGGIGTTAIIQAPPDGYTFGVGVVGLLAVTPHLRKVPYKTDEVSYVTLLTRSTHVLAVAADSPYRTLKDFVDAAHKAPGRINYGHVGIGGSTHLAGELIANETKSDIVHVPYQGAGGALTAVLAGQVQAASVEISGVFPLLSKLRVLAVLSEQRSPSLPDVPTAVEQGYPNIISQSVYGVIAATGTPAPIIERMRQASIAAITAPEVVDQLGRQGQVVTTSTPEEYKRFMVSEFNRWRTVVRDRKISME